MIATTGGDKIALDNRLADLTGVVSKDSPHPIAHGSFGDVWKCTYTASNRQGSEVAVKSIRIDESQVTISGPDSELLKDSWAIYGSNCHHENILPLRGFSHGFKLLSAIIFPWTQWLTHRIPWTPVHRINHPTNIRALRFSGTLACSFDGQFCEMVFKICSERAIVYPWENGRWK
ncbi:uncharacterized protein F5891DRAFT_535904 [Suillus fuscotomentosus]|uniref:Uncharacterized protein n=1 Tax=Suillus fuscotomentosus TaxID=1912939 RepID=A0AAD4E0N0_9AGAM|nr:uncharacterized protein F5891DRAFT_535904 [Suillus fuscotomentosus]KAG1897380.1 hypothetical protein F5891DRAFT_535904 [Suillus fuscotomentosus]